MRFVRATVIGSQSADFIMASGLIVPHKQAGHMTAPDQTAKNVTFPLQRRGRPHMTLSIQGYEAAMLLA